jgi:GYF domain 2
MSDAWYFDDGRGAVGPLSGQELAATLTSYPNPQSMFVWRAGFEEWKRPGDVWELADLLPATPQPPPLPPSMSVRADPYVRVSQVSEPDNELPAAPHVRKYNNFIAKNWRGEYPLWLTYWIFGLLGNVIVGVIPVVVNASSENRGYQPITILATAVIIWLSVGAFAIWQVVAVWRSASRRIQERALVGKRAPWAGLAKFAVVIGLLRLIAAFGNTGIPQLTELSSMAFMDDPSIPSYSIRVMRNGTEVEVTGGFKYGLTDDFLKILRASPQIKVVHLNSVGGRIGEAESLNKVIRDRNLTTYTSSHCLSACTVAFAGGRERWILRRAKLGFHSPAFPGLSDADLALAVNSQKEIFTAAGIEARFISRALATPNKEMWRPSLDELRRANVITGISGGSDFAASGFGAEVSRESMSSSLAEALPTLRAMKERVPEKYDSVIDAYYGSYVAGGTETEMFGAVRRTLVPIIASYRPLADDAVVVELARVYIEQYEALRAINPTSCYYYASGAGGVGSVPSGIPESLIQRENSLNERVILTTATRPTVTERLTRPLWEKVSKQLTAKGFGREKLDLIQSSTVDRSKHADYCDAAVAFMREIVNLKLADAATLMREMWSAQ